jgi:succinate-acetate transporter protein
MSAEGRGTGGAGGDVPRGGRGDVGARADRGDVGSRGDRGDRGDIAPPAEREAATAGQQTGGWSPADPGPLGLAAFALTTFVLSLYNSELVSADSEAVVFGLTLFYGGIAQLLAGMWEFRTGNTFGAVAFSSFGAFWLSFWALNVFYAKEITGGETAIGHGVGLFLWAWAIFTLIMFVASLRTTGAVALVLALLFLTFVVLAIEESGGSSTKLGGYLGIVTALAAWYAAAAAVINSTFGKTLLPVVPLSRS